MDGKLPDRAANPVVREPVKLAPHVAVTKLPPVANLGTVVTFKPRVASVAPKTPLAATVKSATRGKKRVVPPVVECGKASKNTWAFRFRWNSLEGRPVHYISRVTDEVYQAITQDKEIYGQYKAQLRRIYESGTLRASNRTNTSATGTF